VLYTSYSHHQFPCRRAIHIIFAPPISLYTCYTHHILTTSFHVDVLYASYSQHQFPVDVLYTSYSQHQFPCRRSIHIMSCSQELCSKYIYVILVFLLNQIHRLGYGKVDQSQDFSELLMPGIHKCSTVRLH